MQRPSRDRPARGVGEVGRGVEGREIFPDLWEGVRVRVYISGWGFERKV